MSKQKIRLDTAQRQKLTLWLHANPDYVKANSDSTCAAKAQQDLGFAVGKGNICTPRRAMYPDVDRPETAKGTGGVLSTLKKAVADLQDRLTKLEKGLGC